MAFANPKRPAMPEKRDGSLVARMSLDASSIARSVLVREKIPRITRPMRGVGRTSRRVARVASSS